MLYNIANPHGGDIYGEEKIELDYSANTNPYGTPEGVRRAITESLGSLDRYPDAKCRRLLRSLAGHEGVPRDYLICGNGAAEVIYAYCEAVGARAPWAAAQSSPNPLSEAAAFQAAQSSPNPLSEAAAFPATPEALRAAELAPTFAEYSLAFMHSCADVKKKVGSESCSDEGKSAVCDCGSKTEQNDCLERDTREKREIIRYRLKKENGFAPDAGLLSFIEKEQPHVFFLCHPNNPTGIPFEEGLLREIIALCGKLSIRIFLDECFLDLTSGIWDAKEMLAENPHLFILKAFTKSYGMAGVRLGFGMTADTALLEKMSRAVQPWNVSTPAQAAGIAALKEKEFLQKTVALIEKERPYLKSELEKMGYYTTDSVTNYILFEAEKDLAKELRKQGIAIRECENYQGLDAGWYRIAVRTHEENEKLISAIRKVRGK